MDFRTLFNTLEDIATDHEPQVGDIVAIEMGDTLVETYIEDIAEDGVIIKVDETALKLMIDAKKQLLESNEQLDELKCWPGYSRVQGVPAGAPGSCKKKTNEEELNEGSYKQMMQADAEKMTLEQFLEKYDPHGEHKEFITQFYKNARDEEEEVDEAKYQGREVPLGKPMAGDVKKSKVYVRGPKGNVVKVNFGDKKMKIKKSNPKRRKSFRARHHCENPGPRWKARYWSCRAW